MNTTVATPAAKKTSSQAGESPRSMSRVSTSKSKNSARPTTTMISCRTTSTTTIAAIRWTRERAKPRIDRHATHAMIPAAAIDSSAPRPSGAQNAAR